MTRNVKIVLLVSVLFGASTGIYEFVLPYYLQERGVSPQAMGAIFSVAAVGMLVLRIVMGRLADLWGRKLFYGVSFAGSSVAMWLTSSFGSLLSQSLLKTLREAMFLTRDTVHPIVLYEESRGKFMRWLGKTRGFEFLFQAGGTEISGLTLTGAVVLGVGLPALGTAGNLRLAAVLTAIGFVLFWLVYREHWVRPETASAERVWEGVRNLLSFDLHPNLKVLAVSLLIFNIGLTTSHSFVMMLYFPDKFGVSKALTGSIMVLHRATIALPLLFISGSIVKRHLRAAYIWSLIAEGAVIGGGGLHSQLLRGRGDLAAARFHRGGGVDADPGLHHPGAHRPETRALEMGKVLAFGSIGAILGPLLSGYLYSRNINAPFIASGLLMIVAALVLYGMRLEQVEATVAAAR